MKVMRIGDILKAMANGDYDGERSDSEMNGVQSGFYIQDGIPAKYRERTSWISEAT